jgi:hypothetical protein
MRWPIQTAFAILGSNEFERHVFTVCQSQTQFFRYTPLGCQPGTLYASDASCLIPGARADPSR